MVSPVYYVVECSSVSKELSGNNYSGKAITNSSQPMAGTEISFNDDDSTGSNEDQSGSRGDNMTLDSDDDDYKYDPNRMTITVSPLMRNCTLRTTKMKRLSPSMTTLRPSPLLTLLLSFPVAQM